MIFLFNLTKSYHCGLPNGQGSTSVKERPHLLDHVGAGHFNIDFQPHGRLDQLRFLKLELA